MASGPEAPESGADQPAVAVPISPQQVPHVHARWAYGTKWVCVPISSLRKPRVTRLPRAQITAVVASDLQLWAGIASSAVIAVWQLCLVVSASWSVNGVSSMQGMCMQAAAAGLFAAALAALVKHLRLSVCSLMQQVCHIVACSFRLQVLSPIARYLHSCMYYGVAVHFQSPEGMAVWLGLLSPAVLGQQYAQSRASACRRMSCLGPVGGHQASALSALCSWVGTAVVYLGLVVGSLVFVCCRLPPADYNTIKHAAPAHATSQSPSPAARPAHCSESTDPVPEFQVIPDSNSYAAEAALPPALLVLLRGYGLQVAATLSSPFPAACATLFTELQVREQVTERLFNLIEFLGREHPMHTLLRQLYSKGMHKLHKEGGDLHRQALANPANGWKEVGSLRKLKSRMKQPAEAIPAALETAEAIPAALKTAEAIPAVPVAGEGKRLTDAIPVRTAVGPVHGRGRSADAIPAAVHNHPHKCHKPPAEVIPAGRAVVNQWGQSVVLTETISVDPGAWLAVLTVSPSVEIRRVQQAGCVEHGCTTDVMPVGGTMQLQVVQSVGSTSWTAAEELEDVPLRSVRGTARQVALGKLPLHSASKPARMLPMFTSPAAIARAAEGELPEIIDLPATHLDAMLTVPCEQPSWLGTGVAPSTDNVASLPACHDTLREIITEAHSSTVPAHLLAVEHRCEQFRAGGEYDTDDLLNSNASEDWFWRNTYPDSISDTDSVHSDKEPSTSVASRCPLAGLTPAHSIMPVKQLLSPICISDKTTYPAHQATKAINARIPTFMRVRRSHDRLIAMHAGPLSRLAPVNVVQVARLQYLLRRASSRMAAAAGVTFEAFVHGLRHAHSGGQVTWQLDVDQWLRAGRALDTGLHPGPIPDEGTGVLPGRRAHGSLRATIAWWIRGEGALPPMVEQDVMIMDGEAVGQETVLLCLQNIAACLDSLVDWPEEPRLGVDRGQWLHRQQELVRESRVDFRELGLNAALQQLMHLCHNLADASLRQLHLSMLQHVSRNSPVVMQADKRLLAARSALLQYRTIARLQHAGRLGPLIELPQLGWQCMQRLLPAVLAEAACPVPAGVAADAVVAVCNKWVFGAWLRHGVIVVHRLVENGRLSAPRATRALGLVQAAREALADELHDVYEQVVVTHTPCHAHPRSASVCMTLVSKAGEPPAIDSAATGMKLMRQIDRFIRWCWQDSLVELKDEEFYVVRFLLVIEPLSALGQLFTQPRLVDDPELAAGSIKDRALIRCRDNRLEFLRQQAASQHTSSGQAASQLELMVDEIYPPFTPDHHLLQVLQQDRTVAANRMNLYDLVDFAKRSVAQAEMLIEEDRAVHESRDCTQKLHYMSTHDDAGLRAAAKGLLDFWRLQKETAQAVGLREDKHTPRHFDQVQFQSPSDFRALLKMRNEMVKAAQGFTRSDVRIFECQRMCNGETPMIAMARLRELADVLVNAGMSGWNADSAKQLMWDMLSNSSQEGGTFFPCELMVYVNQRRRSSVGVVGLTDDAAELTEGMVADTIAVWEDLKQTEPVAMTLILAELRFRGDPPAWTFAAASAVVKRGAQYILNMLSRGRVAPRGMPTAESPAQGGRRAGLAMTVTGNADPLRVGMRPGMAYGQSNPRAATAGGYGGHTDGRPRLTGGRTGAPTVRPLTPARTAMSYARSNPPCNVCSRIANRAIHHRSDMQCYLSGKVDIPDGFTLRDPALNAQLNRIRANRRLSASMQQDRRTVHFAAASGSGVRDPARPAGGTARPGGDKGKGVAVAVSNARAVQPAWLDAWAPAPGGGAGGSGSAGCFPMRFQSTVDRTFRIGLTPAHVHALDSVACDGMEVQDLCQQRVKEVRVQCAHIWWFSRWSAWEKAIGGGWAAYTCARCHQVQADNNDGRIVSCMVRTEQGDDGELLYPQPPPAWLAAREHARAAAQALGGEVQWPEDGPLPVGYIHAALPQTQLQLSQVNKLLLCMQERLATVTAQLIPSCSHAYRWQDDQLLVTGRDQNVWISKCLHCPHTCIRMLHCTEMPFYFREGTPVDVPSVRVQDRHIPVARTQEWQPSLPADACIDCMEGGVRIVPDIGMVNMPEHGLCVVEGFGASPVWLETAPAGGAVGMVVVRTAREALAHVHQDQASAAHPSEMPELWFTTPQVTSLIPIQQGLHEAGRAVDALHEHCVAACDHGWHAEGCSKEDQPCGWRYKCENCGVFADQLADTPRNLVRDSYMYKLFADHHLYLIQRMHARNEARQLDPTRTWPADRLVPADPAVLLVKPRRGASALHDATRAIPDLHRQLDVICRQLQNTCQSHYWLLVSVKMCGEVGEFRCSHCSLVEEGVLLGPLARRYDMGRAGRAAHNAWLVQARRAEGAWEPPPRPPVSPVQSAEVDSTGVAAPAATRALPDEVSSHPAVPPSDLPHVHVPSSMMRILARLPESLQAAQSELIAFRSQVELQCVHTWVYVRDARTGPGTACRHFACHHCGITTTDAAPTRQNLLAESVLPAGPMRASIRHTREHLRLSLRAMNEAIEPPGPSSWPDDAILLYPSSRVFTVPAAVNDSLCDLRQAVATAGLSVKNAVGCRAALCDHQWQLQGHVIRPRWGGSDPPALHGIFCCLRCCVTEEGKFPGTDRGVVIPAGTEGDWVRELQLLESAHCLDERLLSADAPAPTPMLLTAVLQQPPLHPAGSPEAEPHPWNSDRDSLGWLEPRPMGYGASDNGAALPVIIHLPRAGNADSSGSQTGGSKRARGLSPPPRQPTWLDAPGGGVAMPLLHRARGMRQVGLPRDPLIEIVVTAAEMVELARVPSTPAVMAHWADLFVTHLQSCCVHQFAARRGRGSDASFSSIARYHWQCRHCSHSRGPFLASQEAENLVHCLLPHPVDDPDGVFAVLRVRRRQLRTAAEERAARLGLPALPAWSSDDMRLLISDHQFRLTGHWARQLHEISRRADEFSEALAAVCMNRLPRCDCEFQLIGAEQPGLAGCVLLFRCVLCRRSRWDADVNCVSLADIPPGSAWQWLRDMLRPVPIDAVDSDVEICSDTDDGGSAAGGVLLLNPNEPTFEEQPGPTGPVAMMMVTVPSTSQVADVYRRVRYHDDALRVLSFDPARLQFTCLLCNCQCEKTMGQFGSVPVLASCHVCKWRCAADRWPPAWQHQAVWQARPDPPADLSPAAFGSVASAQPSSPGRSAVEPAQSRVHQRAVQSVIRSIIPQPRGAPAGLLVPGPDPAVNKLLRMYRPGSEAVVFRLLMSHASTHGCSESCLNALQQVLACLPDSMQAVAQLELDSILSPAPASVPALLHHVSHLPSASAPPALRFESPAHFDPIMLPAPSSVPGVSAALSPAFPAAPVQHTTTSPEGVGGHGHGRLPLSLPVSGAGGGVSQLAPLSVGDPVQPEWGRAHMDAGVLRSVAEVGGHSRSAAPQRVSVSAGHGAGPDRDGPITADSMQSPIGPDPRLLVGEGTWDVMSGALAPAYLTFSTDALVQAGLWRDGARLPDNVLGVQTLVGLAKLIEELYELLDSTTDLQLDLTNEVARLNAVKSPASTPRQPAATAAVLSVPATAPLVYGTSIVERLACLEAEVARLKGTVAKLEDGMAVESGLNAADPLQSAPLQGAQPVDVQHPAAAVAEVHARGGRDSVASGALESPARAVAVAPAEVLTEQEVQSPSAGQTFQSMEGGAELDAPVDDASSPAPLESQTVAPVGQATLEVRGLLDSSGPTRRALSKLSLGSPLASVAKGLFNSASKAALEVTSMLGRELAVPELPSPGLKLKTRAARSRQIEDACSAVKARSVAARAASKAADMPMAEAAAVPQRASPRIAAQIAAKALAAAGAVLGPEAGGASGSGANACVTLVRQEGMVENLMTMLGMDDSDVLVAGPMRMSRGSGAEEVSVAGTGWPKVHPSLHPVITRDALNRMQDGCYQASAVEQDWRAEILDSQPCVVRLKQDRNRPATLFKLFSSDDRKMHIPQRVLVDTGAEIGIGIRHSIAVRMGLTWRPDSQLLRGIGGVGGSMGMTNQRLRVRLGGAEKPECTTVCATEGCYLAEIAVIVLTNDVCEEIGHDVIMGQKYLQSCLGTVDNLYQELTFSPAFMHEACTDFRVSVPLVVRTHGARPRGNSATAMVSRLHPGFPQEGPIPAPQEYQVRKAVTAERNAAQQHEALAAAREGLQKAAGRLAGQPTMHSVGGMHVIEPVGVCYPLSQLQQAGLLQEDMRLLVPAQMPQGKDEVAQALAKLGAEVRSQRAATRAEQLTRVPSRSGTLTQHPETDAVVEPGPGQTAMVGVHGRADVSERRLVWMQSLLRRPFVRLHVSVFAMMLAFSCLPVVTAVSPATGAGARHFGYSLPVLACTLAAFIMLLVIARRAARIAPLIALCSGGAAFSVMFAMLSHRASVLLQLIVWWVAILAHQAVAQLLGRLKARLDCVVRGGAMGTPSEVMETVDWRVMALPASAETPLTVGSHSRAQQEGSLRYHLGQQLMIAERLAGELRVVRTFLAAVLLGYCSAAPLGSSKPVLGVMIGCLVGAMVVVLIARIGTGHRRQYWRPRIRMMAAKVVSWLRPEQHVPGTEIADSPPTARRMSVWQAQAVVSDRVQRAINFGLSFDSDGGGSHTRSTQPSPRHDVWAEGVQASEFRYPTASDDDPDSVVNEGDGSLGVATGPPDPAEVPRRRTGRRRRTAAIFRKLERLAIWLVLALAVISMFRLPAAVKAAGTEGVQGVNVAGGIMSFKAPEVMQQQAAALEYLRRMPHNATQMAAQFHHGLDSHLPDGETIAVNTDEHWTDPESKLVVHKHAHLSEGQFQAMVDMLRECVEKGAVAYSMEELTGYTGRCGPVTIDIVSNKPILAPCRRNFSQAEKEIIDEKVQALVKAGMVREIQFTDYSSNIVLALKRAVTGEWSEKRFCVNFIPLNKDTRMDRYGSHKAEDLMERASQCKYLTCLDLRAGFHQLPLAEKDVPKTAFWYVSATGAPPKLMAYNRLPFGLKNASSAFQRVMDAELMAAGCGEFAWAYIDDVIIGSNTWEEHIIHVRTVLTALAAVNLRIHPQKSLFGTNRCEYLGHNIMGQHGVTMSEAKVAAIKALPVPKDVPQLRSVLGFLAYYRHFIPGFSSIAAPITKLLGKSQPWVWAEEQQRSYETLRALMTDPKGCVLRPVDPSKPLIVHTDWSTHGIGAVLGQLDDKGQEYLCACISRSLNKHEKNYPSYKGELLALTWAVKSFRKHVHGTTFTVMTDHQPLLWLMGAKDLMGQYSRWQMMLQEHDFVVQHRPGLKHCNADTLSRFPQGSAEDMTGARLDEDSGSEGHAVAVAALASRAAQAEIDSFCPKFADLLGPVATYIGPQYYMDHVMMGEQLQPDESAGVPEPGQSNATEVEAVLAARDAAVQPEMVCSPGQAVGSAELDISPVGREFYPVATQKGVALIELCGGLAAGLEAVLLAGFKVLKYLYADIDPAARQVARHRLGTLTASHPDLISAQAWEHAFNAPQDLHQLETHHLDSFLGGLQQQVVIVAGWPCQDYSPAGRGRQGQRAALLDRVLPIIQHLQQVQLQYPPAYILENVALQFNFRHRHIREVVAVELMHRLGEPIVIDAVRVGSYAHRLRNFWTNLMELQPAQEALDQAAWEVKGDLRDILEPGREPAPVHAPLSSPHNVQGRVRKVLPTLMAYRQSRAFRPGQAGAITDLATGAIVEPSAVERERAMGYLAGATAAPELRDGQRCELLGNAMDLNSLVALFEMGRILADEDLQQQDWEQTVLAVSWGCYRAAARRRGELSLVSGQQHQLLPAAAVSNIVAPVLVGDDVDVGEIWMDGLSLAYLQRGELPMDRAQRRRVLRRGAHYRWHNQRLFKVVGASSVAGVMYREVPEPKDRDRVTLDMHVNLGHMGEKRTIAAVSRAYWWHGLTVTVRRVLSGCKVCRRVQASGGHQQRDMQTEPTGEFGIFHRWGLDYIADLPASALGNMHVLVAIDYFSKWVEAVPVSDLSAGTTVRVFTLEVLSRYGVPAQVITDNGGSFKGEFEQMCHQRHIKQRTITPDVPRSNGLAERAVQTIKGALRKHVSDKGNALTWDTQGLSAILAGYRSTPQASTKYSPACILFATDPVLDAAQFHDSEHIDFLHKDIKVPVSQLLRRAQMARELGTEVLHNLRTAHERDTLRFKARRAGLYVPKVYHFHPGDHVFILAQGQKPGGTLGIRARNEVLQVREVRATGVLILVNQAGRIFRKHMEHCVPCRLPNIMTDVFPGVLPPAADHPCHVCGDPGQEELMLLCDGCNAGYHIHCLEPPLDSVPEGTWVCQECTVQGVTAEALEERQGKYRADRRSEPAKELPSKRRIQDAEQVAAWHGRGVFHQTSRRYGRMVFQGIYADKWLKVLWQDGTETEYTPKILPRMRAVPEGQLPAGVPAAPAAAPAIMASVSVGAGSDSDDEIGFEPMVLRALAGRLKVAVAIHARAERHPIEVQFGATEVAAVEHRLAALQSVLCFNRIRAVVDLWYGNEGVAAAMQQDEMLTVVTNCPGQCGYIVDGHENPFDLSSVPRLVGDLEEVMVVLELSVDLSRVLLPLLSALRCAVLAVLMPANLLNIEAVDEFAWCQEMRAEGRLLQIELDPGLAQESCSWWLVFASAAARQGWLVKPLARLIDRVQFMDGSLSC